MSMSRSNKFPSYTFKMILLGESGSGKTCLFHRIVHDRYRDAGTYNHKSTKSTRETPSGSINIHYDHYTKEVYLSGSNKANIRVFDTAGRERANSLTHQYYRHAQIICLVYSVDSELSLNSLGKWVEDARFYLDDSQDSSPKHLFVLVGLKSDIPAYQREVKAEDVKRFAQHFEITSDCCFELSNVTGEGVAEMLQFLTQKMYDKQTQQQISELEDYSKFSAGNREPHVHISKTFTYSQLLWKCCCCCCFCCKRNDYQTLDGYET